MEHEKLDPAQELVQLREVQAALAEQLESATAITKPAFESARVQAEARITELSAEVGTLAVQAQLELGELEKLERMGLVETETLEATRQQIDALRQLIEAEGEAAHVPAAAPIETPETPSAPETPTSAPAVTPDQESDVVATPEKPKRKVIVTISANKRTLQIGQNKYRVAYYGKSDAGKDKDLTKDRLNALKILVSENRPLGRQELWEKATGTSWHDKHAQRFKSIRDWMLSLHYGKGRSLSLIHTVGQRSAVRFFKDPNADIELRHADKKPLYFGEGKEGSQPKMIDTETKSQTKGQESQEVLEELSTIETALLAACIDLRKPYLEYLGLPVLSEEVRQKIESGLGGARVDLTAEEIDQMRWSAVLKMTQLLAEYDWLTEFLNVLPKDDPRIHFLEYAISLDEEQRPLFAQVINAISMNESESVAGRVVKSHTYLMLTSHRRLEVINGIVTEVNVEPTKTNLDKPVDETLILEQPVRRKLLGAEIVDPSVDEAIEIRSHETVDLLAQDSDDILVVKDPPKLPRGLARAFQRFEPELRPALRELLDQLNDLLDREWPRQQWADALIERGVQASFLRHSRAVKNAFERNVLKEGAHPGQALNLSIAEIAKLLIDKDKRFGGRGLFGNKGFDKAFEVILDQEIARRRRQNRQK